MIKSVRTCSTTVLRCCSDGGSDCGASNGHRGTNCVMPGIRHLGVSASRSRGEAPRCQRCREAPVLCTPLQPGRLPQGGGRSHVVGGGSAENFVAEGLYP